MPNWCSNVLTIRGSSGDLQRFRADNAYKGKPVDASEVIDVPLSFEKHLPTPEEFRGKPSPPPGHKSQPGELSSILDGTMPPYDWYTWRVANWGTKWDLCERTQVNEDYEDGMLQYSFDTAWSPPIPWVLSVSQKYRDLSFHLQYEEGGCDFEGYMKIVNGQTIEERAGEYTRCHECGQRKCDCPPQEEKG